MIFLGDLMLENIKINWKNIYHTHEKKITKIKICKFTDIKIHKYIFLHKFYLYTIQKSFKSTKLFFKTRICLRNL